MAAFEGLVFKRHWRKRIGLYFADVRDHRIRQWGAHAAGGSQNDGI